jgi:hypothetical protein
VRDALLSALVACAHSRPSRWRTRRFLTGLSSDELQFIAEYLGSRILGSSASCQHPSSAFLGRSVPCQRADAGIAACRSQDREHKMILLMEFLGRTGLQQTPRRTGTAHWN